MRSVLVVVALVASSFVASPASDAAFRVRTVVGGPKTVAPGKLRASVVAKCPVGWSVIGGGSQVGGYADGQVLVGSHPWDGEDAGKTPDDGWRVVTSNTDDGPHDMRAVAICVRKGSYRYRKATRSVESGLYRNLAVSCRDDEQVVGGGGVISGTHPSIQLASSGPFDGADGDADNDDGWDVAAHQNTGTGDLSLTAWAICTKGSPLTYHSTTTPINDNAIVGTRTSCPAGDRVVGGGITLTASFSLYLGASLPDGGWFAVIANHSGQTRQFTTTAICRTA